MSLFNAAREEPGATWICLPSHPEVLPLQDESATPWPPNSLVPAALTHTVAYAGLALHPQHPCCGAITQSLLLPLHLGTKINSKQRRQSRQRQAFQTAMAQPCSPLGLLHPRQR